MIRVVHCGTGLTGREALRAIIEDPALELVGQYVSTPDKIGRDAGELCGLAPVGVAASGDLDEVVSLGADCLCYASNAGINQDCYGQYSGDQKPEQVNHRTASNRRPIPISLAFSPEAV